MSAAKVIVTILVFGLLAYIGYHQFASNPLKAKEAIEEGITQVRAAQKLGPEQEQLLRVQLALTDYITRRGEPPESLEALVPEYFDSVPTDPKTGEVYPYKRTGNTYNLGKQIELASLAAENTPQQEHAATPGEPAPAAGGASDFVNPNTMQIEDFVYDAGDKRDPFMPFDLSMQRTFDESVPPLERYKIGELKVTAILLDSKGEFTALVEDEAGRGFPVRQGTKIGDANGVVVSIEKDRLNIIESRVDFTGQETKTPVIMQLDSNKDPNFQKLKGNKKKKKGRK